MAAPRGCDASHRNIFSQVVLYALPTTGEFNMCNCTASEVHPGPFHPSRPTTSGTRANRPEQPRPQSHAPSRQTDPSGGSGGHANRPGDSGPAAGIGGMPSGTPRRTQKDRAGPGGVQRDRTTYPHVTGMEPVGAGTRRVELWVGSPGVGGPFGALLWLRRQGCVRPRCAAAEYPQAVRGPLPRGTGDVHRAYGWT